MEKFKNKNTKAVRVNVPIDLHLKFTKIKAYKLITESKEPSFSDLIIEVMRDALTLPKYSKINSMKGSFQG